jgi:hypothetical protein
MATEWAEQVRRLAAALMMTLATASWAIAGERDELDISASSPETAIEAEGIPSNAELWKLLQQQQSVIDEQQAEIRQLNERLEATGEMVERVQTSSDDSNAGSRWFDRTTLGGYGEIHYNNLENKRAGGKSKKEIDFHRFVLFLDHEFTESIRFISELEIEHALAGDGKPGEVEIEQAFLQFDLFDNYTAATGLFLVPVGILNEIHEPPTFYGVERNPIENKIVPTTWWEAGAMFSGRYDNGLSFDLALTSGLESDGFNIRSGRQKVAKADASDGALTGRLTWRGYPGLELGVTAQFQEDINGTGPHTPASLFEAHAVYNHGPFGVRALYARWDLFSDAADVGGKNEQYGFYIEPSYRLNEKFGFFTRYNQWNNAAGNDATSNSRYRQWDVGMNFWPHPDVVLKIDYQNQDAPTGKDEFDGINVGMGYQF